MALKKGDKVFWYGNGSLKNKKFFGKVIELDVLKDDFGKASRVRADKGQGMIIDENYVYNKFLKKGSH